MSDAPTPPERPWITLQFGRRTLSGAPAVAILLLVLAGAIALVAVQAPHLRFTPLVASALVWLAFLVHWSATAAGGATFARVESALARLLHAQVLNFGVLLLFLRLPGTTARWVPDGRWPLVAGFVLQAAGFALAVWARRQAGRVGSGAIASPARLALVRTGPYRKLRHPLYSSMLAMVFGSALVGGELHGLCAFAIVGFALARRIPLEDAVMRATFGDAWYAYRASTWALLPGLY